MMDYKKYCLLKLSRKPLNNKGKHRFPLTYHYIIIRIIPKYLNKLYTDLSIDIDQSK